jgi:hypothetical protein
MSDAPSESEAQCHSAQGKSSASSLETVPEMLPSEVTPGLRQEQSPTPIILMSQFVYKGMIKWK